MVNIIRMRQEEREIKLKNIRASIEKAMVEKQNISYDKTLMAIVAHSGISKRTAVEYLDVVLFRLELNRKDLDDHNFPNLEELEKQAQLELDLHTDNNKIKQAIQDKEDLDADKILEKI